MIPVVLVETKVDMDDESTVSVDESAAQAVELGLGLFRVSSKQNLNVNEVFYRLCFDYVRRRRLLGGQVENPCRPLDELIPPKPSSVANFSIGRSHITRTSYLSNCVISFSARFVVLFLIYQMIIPRRFVLYRPELYGRDALTGNGAVCDPLSFLFESEGTSSDSTPASPSISGLSTVSYLKLSSFMYALTNVTSLAVPFFLKDTLMLTPSQLALFSAFCATPSFLKPIVTSLVRPKDRSSTLVACASTQAAMYLTVGLVVQKGIATVPLVCGCMFAHSVATAIGTVLSDTMTIESAAKLSSDREAHFLFSDMAMIKRVGLLPVSYLSGYLLSFVAPATIVGAAAVFPATVAVAASFLSNEANEAEKTANELTMTDQFALATRAIRDTDKGLMSTVTGRGLVMSLAPSYADAMFFYFTQEMGLSAEFLGRFQLLGSIAGIVGNLTSRYSTHPKQLSNFATIASVPMYFSILTIVGTGITASTGYSHLLSLSVGSFVLVRHFAIDFLIALTAQPAAVQLMRTAPKGAEGTYLALVGTLGDVGGVVNSLISSLTMNWFELDGSNFTGLFDFIVVCNTATAAATPSLLYYGPESVIETSSEPEKVAVHEKSETNERDMSPVRDA